MLTLLNYWPGLLVSLFIKDLINHLLVLSFAGEDEGRQSADPSRRRSPVPPLITSGSLSRQKSPIGNDSTSKEAMVSLSWINRTSIGE